MRDGQKLNSTESEWHNKCIYLREQNRGSSLLSPQSFTLSQNLFAATHCPLVHVYSASVHLDAVPKWPPSFDLRAAAVPNTLIDSCSILLPPLSMLSFRCAIVVAIGGNNGDGDGFTDDVTEPALALDVAVVLPSSMVWCCPSIHATNELLFIENIICCATNIWTMSFKAIGHHGADELLIITVPKKRVQKKKTICVKNFHVYQIIKSMR